MHKWAEDIQRRVSLVLGQNQKASFSATDNVGAVKAHDLKYMTFRGQLFSFLKRTLENKGYYFDS